MKSLLSGSVCLCAALIVSAPLRAQDYLQVPCAMHVSSVVSDGKYAPAEVLAAAKSAGVQVLILTDRDRMRWEYGIWPLRWLLKKTLSRPSVFSYGVQRYLDDIEKLNAANPDTLVLAGVESAPYYYWQGSPLDGTLTLKNWHVHMLAVGLKSAADLAGLPVTGAGAGCDAYQGDRGSLPYQSYIDYVRGRQGLTFWVHPWAANRGTQAGASFATEPYLHVLEQTHGYTGIAVLSDGYDALGRPGGLWDRILMQYCSGSRAQPVWMVAGLGYDRSGDLESFMRSIRLTLLLKSFDRQQVLEALASGRCYAASGAAARGFVLEEFSVSAEGKEPALMGQTLVSSRPAQVRIRARLLRGQAQGFTVQLVNEAGVAAVFEAPQGECDIAWDAGQACPRPGFYRLIVQSPQLRALSNPIFVKPEST